MVGADDNLLLNRFLPYLDYVMLRLDTKCVECGSGNVFYDQHRAEIYCSDCGLVLVQLHKTPNENLFLDYDFSDYKEAVELSEDGINIR